VTVGSGSSHLPIASSSSRNGLLGVPMAAEVCTATHQLMLDIIVCTLLPLLLTPCAIKAIQHFLLLSFYGALSFCYDIC
jgi:hypothetical protein